MRSKLRLAMRRTRSLNSAAMSERSATPREAVAYARVSSREQEKEGFSIPAQRKLWEDYARQHALRVVCSFEEAETAKKAGRAKFDEMIALLKKNPSRYVVLVEKTDRVYRNLRDYVTLDDLVQDGLEIHLIKENAVLSREARSTEKLVHGIKVLMAKNYIDNLSEETRKGLTEKAEQGMWPSQAPLGFRNSIGTDRKRFMERDPDFAPLIANLFEWFASGLHSLQDAARKARADGLRFRKSKAALPKSTMHQILRNPIYMGEFDWAGKHYSGKFEPIVSRDLWQRVQSVLDRRFEKRHRKVKHDFAFARLIECGHCGCAMVGELKKGKYVYYHCTGAKGKVAGTKCPEPYTREEVLDAKFGEVLKGLRFDEEIVTWVASALRESHADEKLHHDHAIAALQAEYRRIQNRIDAMYLDKLDGRIDAGFFDRQAAEWRSEQDRVTRSIQEHQGANQTYLEEGVRLLELSRRAYELFRKQPAGEKRKMLDFVLSNCSWKDGELTATFRQPFDIIATTAANDQLGGASLTDTDRRSEIWLPIRSAAPTKFSGRGA